METARSSIGADGVFGGGREGDAFGIITGNEIASDLGDQAK